LKGLQFKSFVLQAQCEVFTKLAFTESKRGKDLSKKSEDHERRILDLITSQKERLVYYEKMVSLTDSDKENVLKQMKERTPLSMDKNKVVLVTGTKSLESGDLVDDEDLSRKRNIGGV
jgi:hypothetical protein